MTQSTNLPTIASTNKNPLVISKPFSLSSLIGDWTLSSMADEGEILYMNAEFIYDFSSNGMFSVTKYYGEQMIVSNGKVEVDEDNHTVNLMVDGESLKFEVVKITSLEMMLVHNSGLEYNFLKNT